MFIKAIESALKRHQEGFILQQMHSIDIRTFVVNNHSGE